ncbi:hypothetical protein [Chamaesiphon minutus]|uniref:Uncharacterized protein n=1 Tax=Chamaesiphon minutus (strain ATCC 27169 / PCC 6605) TaxID=1173020 RepID=K9U9P4_CHAP6|nr:hypothetical protein [Chamaesiphon minutus]AFY91313.1 hypothetical protein Cha6605_0004 [Chamaesiphon minutus PCC 6605]
MEELPNVDNPLDLLFGGMEKLSLGGNEHTLNVLHLLPTQQFRTIVDAGCGTGRQIMVLRGLINQSAWRTSYHQLLLGATPAEETSA